MSRRPKDTPNPLAAWVRDVRVKQRLSQDAFGAAISPNKPVHRTTVNRWERGDFGLRLDKISMIHKAFPDAPPPPVEGLSDPNRSFSPVPRNGEKNVKTTEGIQVGQELDEIDDIPLRKRARTAALAAIDAERSKSHPPEADADQQRHRARSK